MTDESVIATARPPSGERTAPKPDPDTIVAGLIDRAWAAMDSCENQDQARIDEAITALAWSVYKPDTGLGNVESKVIKNTGKTFGTLGDLIRVRNAGVIGEVPAGAGAGAAP